MLRFLFLACAVLTLAGCGADDDSGRAGVGMDMTDDGNVPVDGAPAYAPADMLAFDELAEGMTLVLAYDDGAVVKVAFTAPGHGYSFDDPDMPGEFPVRFIWEHLDDDTDTGRFTMWWDPEGPPHLPVRGRDAVPGDARGGVPERLLRSRRAGGQGHRHRRVQAHGTRGRRHRGHPLVV